MKASSTQTTSDGVTFDKAFLDEQRSALEERRDQLLRELDDSGVKRSDVSSDDYDPKYPDYGNSEEDNAAEVATFEGNLSITNELEMSLFNVNKALRKVQDGTYGYCEKCGNAIQPDRLRAFPSATACMDCKRKGV